MKITWLYATIKTRMIKVGQIGMYLYVSVLLLFLSSCSLTMQANMANEKVQADISKLHVGMTRAEVRSNLGSVYDRQYHIDNEIWIYYYNMYGKVIPRAFTSKSCLAVTFDGDRTVGWNQGCPPQSASMKSIYLEQGGTISVGVEQSKWLVSFPARGLKRTKSTLPGFFAWNQAPYTLSVIIGPVPKGTSAITCRERSLAKVKKSDSYSQGYKAWESGDVAFSEYVSERQGAKQLHMNKHVVRDGFWYDIHFSKGNPNDNDKSDAIAYLEPILLVERQ